MYAISTTTLVSILALASSVAVVVQATPIYGCTSTVIATATTCEKQVKDWGNVETAAELSAWLIEYNDNVNPGCTNLIKGQVVRVFLF